MNLVLRKLKMVEENLVKQELLNKQHYNTTNPINKELQNNISKILLQLKMV